MQAGKKGADGEELMKASEVLKEWYGEDSGGAVEGWEDDKLVLKWMGERKGAICERVDAAKKTSVMEKVKELVGGLNMTEEEKEAFKREIVTKL